MSMIQLTHEHDSINKILIEKWKIINIKYNNTTDNLGQLSVHLNSDPNFYTCIF